MLCHSSALTLDWPAVQNLKPYMQTRPVCPCSVCPLASLPAMLFATSQGSWSMASVPSPKDSPASGPLHLLFSLLECCSRAACCSCFSL